jgi:hypothetical protein
MTDRDEMVQRIERALEQYERSRMKQKRKGAWSKIRSNGVRLPMRKPKMTETMRVWCADD